MTDHQVEKPAKRPKGRPPKRLASASPHSMDTQILHHAKELFRQKGFSAVSINDIVDSVGISKPTLYYYYQDKDNLYAAVLIHMLQRGKSFIELGVEGETTLRGQLSKLMAGYFEHCPTCLSSLLKDVLEHLKPETRQRIITAYEANILATLEGVFHAGIQNGEIAETDTATMARLFISLVDGFTLNAMFLHGRPFDYRQKAEHIVDLLLNGLQPAKV
jgi:AcrR family transcriptional regulator